jgi:hypothetical protein
VADPLVTSYADIVLSSTADPHLSSFTPITLEFPAGSTDPQCFVVQTEPANGQPDLNHTYTLELQNLTGGAVLGEVAALTVTVTDDAELPEGCPWAGADTTICAGECVYIGCLPLSEENGLCYRWFPDLDISSAYSPYPEVCPKTTTTYIIYITDDQGNLVGSDTVIVTVNPLPAVEITPPNPAICQQTPPGVGAPGGRNNVCSMEPITLSTVETYTVYNWSTGATGPNITVATPGPYRVTVTDANGCSASKEVELAYCTEVTLEVSPTPAQLCEDTLILQANAGFVSYLWSDNSTGSSLIVTEPGTYSVTVQDAGGCFAVEEIEVPYCAATSVDLTIYNGLYDWVSDTSWSGGQPISEDREVHIGAVTVANLNNTDGDYMPGDTTELADHLDNDVRPVNNSVVGRNEIDLMKLVIRRDAGVPASAIKLRKKSGQVKLWRQPFKGTEVSMPGNVVTLNAPGLSFSMDTMVLYIEAIAKSGSVRDIEFQLEYLKQRDTVKATAIWAEQTRGWYARSKKPTVGMPGDTTNLKYFDDPFLIDRLNKDNVSAADSSLYGYGPNFKGVLGNPGSHDPTQFDGSGIDKKLGGRHLVEYQVFPVGVDTLAKEAGIHFDIARQNRAISASYFSGNNVPEELIGRNGEKIYPILFPWEMPFPHPLYINRHRQRDNEYSTDDIDRKDEDAVLPPITRPASDRDANFLYSFDNVANKILLVRAEFRNQDVAFRMTKATFSEFVRISFERFPENGSDVIGSRASNRYLWHCLNYHKRGKDGRLVIDTLPVSHSYPLKIGSATKDSIQIIVKPGAQTRGYSVNFIKDNANSRWVLKSVGMTPSASDTSNMHQTGPWTLETGEVKIIINQVLGTGVIAFNTGHAYTFNIFKTTDPVDGKKCRILPGVLNFTFNPTHLNYLLIFSVFKKLCHESDFLRLTYHLHRNSIGSN